MASAATPAMAKFLMRTLLLKGLPEDGRAQACNQLTDWTDGPVYQDVILPRRLWLRSGSREPPIEGRICLRLVANLLRKIGGSRMLTVSQSRRHQNRDRQTRRHRSRPHRTHRTETGVGTTIGGIASRQSSTFQNWNATGVPSVDCYQLARTILRADGRCGLALDRASNSAVHPTCSDHRQADW